jgi:hypothetical protein
MTAFENFVNLELPRRPTMLTLAVTGYAGDPNDGGAPAIVQNSPAGSFYLRDSDKSLWRKKESTAGTWEETDTGGGTVAPETTTETITMAVDYSGGTSPAPGTIVTTQAEYTALGADLKYVQDVFDILPKYLAADVIVVVSDGNHYAKPGNRQFIDMPPIQRYPKLTQEFLNYNGQYTKRPSIVFQNGNQTVFEAAQGGTVSTDSYGSLIVTRDSGTWTPYVLENKLIKFTSGANSGRFAVVGTNDATTITLLSSFTIANGAGNFEIIEAGAIFLPQYDGIFGAPDDQDFILTSGIELTTLGVSWGSPSAFFDTFRVKEGQVNFLLGSIFANTVRYGSPGITEFPGDKIAVYLQLMTVKGNGYLHDGAEIRHDGAAYAGSGGGLFRRGFIQEGGTCVNLSASYTLDTVGFFFGVNGCYNLEAGVCTFDSRNKSSSNHLFGKGAASIQAFNVGSGDGYSKTAIFINAITPFVIHDAAVGINVFGGEKYKISVNGENVTLPWKIQKGSNVISPTITAFDPTATPIEIDGESYDMPLISNNGWEVVGIGGSRLLYLF